jgi:hypothetical protein
MRDALDRTAPPSLLVRIDATPVLHAPVADAARQAARFAATVRRLPTLFRTPMVAHALSPLLAAPAPLRRLVTGLRGRLTVVNPLGAARLPHTLAVAIRGLVRGALEGTLGDEAERPSSSLHTLASDATTLTSAADARAAHDRRMARVLLANIDRETRERLAVGTDRVRLVLYESRVPTVDVAAASGTPTVGEPAVRASIALDYRIAIAVGDDGSEHGASIDALVAAAPACGWPPDAARSGGVPWFAGQLLVPDAWISAHANAQSLARWAGATGRSGARDGYWFPETWERFLERGRAVGCVTPADIWRARRGRVAGSIERPTSADAWSLHAPSSLTPDLERGICVPPGYALVDAHGALTVSVVSL